MHYNVAIGYVGYTQAWDDLSIGGSIPDRDCLVASRKNGKPMAVASVNRDADSSRVQVAMGPGDIVADEAIVHSE